jgi:hypothetical protein
MTNLIERISIFANHENIPISTMEKSIGASAGVLSRAIKSGHDIQSKWLQLIIDNYHQLSVVWLMTGKGNMIQDRNIESIHKNIDKKVASNDYISHLLSEIEKKDEIIRKQAEEIGRLKAERDISVKKDNIDQAAV